MYGMSSSSDSFKKRTCFPEKNAEETGSRGLSPNLDNILPKLFCRLFLSLSLQHLSAAVYC